MEITAILIFLTVVTIFLVIYIRNNLKGGGSSLNGNEKKLWVECRRAINMPTQEADEIITRSLESLRDKHPGKTEEWYLDKFLYDLQRDRG